MPDNPKKKKLDRKRVSLKQKHEVDYLKKIARDILKGIKERPLKKVKYINSGKLAKICKALLKCLK